MNKRQRKKFAKRKSEKQVNAYNIMELGRQITNRQTTRKPDNCSSDYMECGSDITFTMQQASLYDRFKRLEELDLRLPSLRSTTESFINLTLAKEFVSMKTKEVSEVNQYLQKVNLSDDTNFDTLHQGLIHALIYGRAGFRFLSEEKGFVFVPSDRYTVVYQENSEFLVTNEVLGYIVARPDSTTPFGESMELTHDEQFELDVTKRFGYNENYVYVKKEDFYNFHFYGDAINVDTPLNHDLERIELFMSLVTNLKRTLNKSNSEVTLVKLMEDLFNLNTKQVSDLVATGKTGKDAQNDSILSQVKAFADIIAVATGREALIVPPSADSVEIIQPTIKISDFTSLYDYIETFISKLYGLSQNVLTLDSMPRDASANPIFEQMMKTSVYPKREKVAQFINNFLCTRFGWDFVKYEQESYALGLVATNAQSIATVFSTLANAQATLAKEGLDTSAQSELIEELIYKKLRQTI